MASMLKFFSITVIALIFSAFQLIHAFESPYSKLPSDIYPLKYHLNITSLIHQNILTYNGSVWIDIAIREPTDKIVLNAIKLRPVKMLLINVECPSIVLGGSQLSFTVDKEKEQLRIYWPLHPLVLQIGQQYQLQIDFIADIEENEGIGFYKSTYLNENNNSVSIATTQFEPTGARLAFPCFDEPAFKAKFVISITHGSNYSAISNMPSDGDPVLSSSPNGEMITTKFLETPKMSTYLVAFALTNYHRASALVKGLEHRIFYPPNFKDNGIRALENAIKTVDVLEKLIGVKYTLPKLDQIYMGKLYGFAMENWGLITFRQEAIISNPKDLNKLDLLETINIQSHEIAHQWFGNLVTPASWDCLWLKEGFSSYFSHVAANLVHPDENLFEYFIINELQPIALMNVNHPLANVIKKGDDIKTNMDSVAYHFGANFVRMFHHAIGDSTFMKGIQKYLLTFQFSTADEDDFFKQMQAAVDEDKVQLFQNNQSVTNVMRTWTHNVGIPIVSIIRNYETGTITIRQKPKSGEKEQKWWIPINFVTAANPDFERTVADYIMPPQAEVTLDLKDLNISLSNSDWLIVNKQQTGIFLVVYDDLNLKLIAEALIDNRNKIHRFNRAQILKDLTVTIDEDLDAIEPLLAILESLKFEEESLPWYFALKLIMNVFQRLEDSKVMPKFKTFIYDVFVGFYEKKFKGPFEKPASATDLKAKRNMMILNFELDTVTCQNFTAESASQYFLNGTGDITKPCKLSLCQAIQNATLHEVQAYVDRLCKVMAVDVESVETYEFLSALKCIESKELFEYLLDYVHQPNSVTFSFLDLLVVNKHFRAWVIEYHNDELKKSGLSDLINIHPEKQARFLRKYENNISSWLQKYGENK